MNTKHKMHHIEKTSYMYVSGVTIGVHLLFMFKKVAQCSLVGALAVENSFREVNYITGVCEA